MIWAKIWPVEPELMRSECPVRAANLTGERPEGQQEVGGDRDRRLGGRGGRPRPGGAAGRQGGSEDQDGKEAPGRLPHALALGRALTASCQRRTLPHASGVSTFSRLMKSTATRAVMSAAV